jgi:prepilin-type N-terminal cleavage/methylation domain-containing protein
MGHNPRRQRSAGVRAQDRDAGFTLIEILIVIMLMGLVLTAVLATLQVATKASAVDQEHAIAYSWLQAASDEIYRQPRVPCDSATDPIATYTAYAHAVPRPISWDATSAHIEVVGVEYLGRVTPDADFEWDAAFCFEGGVYVDSPLYTQRITLQATSPTGGLVKTLQMVKNES